MSSVHQRQRSAVEMTGPWKNLENQTAVFHVSHRPLEIANSAISTFPPRRRRFPIHGIRKTKTKTPLAPSWRSRRNHKRSIYPKMNTCPRPLSQGIKSCVLSQPPLAGFEVTPYGRF